MDAKVVGPLIVDGVDFATRGFSPVAGVDAAMTGGALVLAVVSRCVYEGQQRTGVCGGGRKRQGEEGEEWRQGGGGGVEG